MKSNYTNEFFGAGICIPHIDRVFRDKGRAECSATERAWTAHGAAWKPASLAHPAVAAGHEEQPECEEPGGS